MARLARVILERKLQGGLRGVLPTQAKGLQWRADRRYVVLCGEAWCWAARLRAGPAAPPWLTDEQGLIVKTIYAEAEHCSVWTGIPFEMNHIIPLQWTLPYHCGAESLWPARLLDPALFPDPVEPAHVGLLAKRSAPACKREH